MSTPPLGGPRRSRPLDRLPAPVIFALAAVLVFGIGAGPRLLEHHVDTTYFVVRGITALVLAALTTWRFVRTRKAVGGAEGFAELRSALRTGELPAGVPVQGWQEELARRDRQLRRNRWTAPLLALVLAALGVVLVLTAHRDPAAGWLIVGVAIAFGAVAIVRTAQVLPRIESLRTQLDARR
jgi:peptidoglycan/LPS O-acetylase OafA/YrhL